MTAKRFTITQDFEEHHKQIRDNGHIIMGCFLEAQAEPIVKLLNELHEENQSSKEFIEQLQEELVLFKNAGADMGIDLNSKITALKQENGQLQHKLSQQEMEYATTCNRLTEENEQCKMMIATLRNIILENGIDIE